MGLWLFKTLSKCGPNTEVFYSSVVSSSPLVGQIHMMVGKAWWIVSSPEMTQTHCHTSLGLIHVECILSAWWADRADFSSTMVSYTASCKALSHIFACDDSPLPILRVGTNWSSWWLPSYKFTHSFATGYFKTFGCCIVQAQRHFLALLVLFW